MLTSLIYTFCTVYTSVRNACIIKEDVCWRDTLLAVCGCCAVFAVGFTRLACTVLGCEYVYLLEVCGRTFTNTFCLKLRNIPHSKISNNIQIISNLTFRTPIQTNTANTITHTINTLCHIIFHFNQHTIRTFKDTTRYTILYK